MVLVSLVFMSEAKTKSRNFRKVCVRTVKGSKDAFKRKKPKIGSCSATGESLKGVMRALPGDLKGVPRSARRPSRPFGGVLSSRASRLEIKRRNRK